MGRTARLQQLPVVLGMGREPRTHIRPLERADRHLFLRVRLPHHLARLGLTAAERGSQATLRNMGLFTAPQQRRWRQLPLELLQPFCTGTPLERRLLVRYH